MSNSIKGLYDYELVKKCCRCKNILLKSNFYKNKTKRDGYASDCICCRKQYYNENRQKTKKYYEEHRDKIKKYYNENQDRIRKYRSDNKDKINERFRKRKDSDLNFKLACNLRSRTSMAFKSQNIRKINKTFDLLGCSHSFFKNWIIHQLYGNMTIENYASVWQIDHCLPITSFNLLDENDMKKSFNWINLRPMYSNENNSKNNKIDNHLYLCQEIKAKYFLKLNNDQERFNENIH